MTATPGPENPELVLEANQPPHAEDCSEDEGGDRLGHGVLGLALSELGQGAWVPLGEKAELGLDHVERNKDQGHPGKDGKGSERIPPQDAERVSQALSRGGDRNGGHRHRQKDNDQHQSQHHPINGEDRRVNEVALLTVAARQQQGMAELLQKGDLLVFGERTAESGFLFFDLRENLVRQFADDVVLLCLG